MAKLYTVDIENGINKLEKEIAEYQEKFLEGQEEHEFCYEYCESDELTDGYIHSHYCPAHHNGECPLVEQDKLWQTSLQLKRLRLMPGVFHNPELARGNDLIPASFYFTKGRYVYSIC